MVKAAEPQAAVSMMALDRSGRWPELPPPAPGSERGGSIRGVKSGGKRDPKRRGSKAQLVDAWEAGGVDFDAWESVGARRRFGPPLSPSALS
eukprot:SAG11_NODE_12806_length_684_cov_1.070085_1_plen_92_part_00